MNKALNTIKNVFTWLISAVAIGMMIFTIISVFTLNQRDRNVFGYRAFIVLSDSMSATDFDAGDVVIAKEVDPTTLKEGDIIAFISQDPDYFGETITHKIRRRTTNENGDPAFVTYGTTTGIDDNAVVTYPYILGIYVKALPKVGTFFTFLKTTPGYIICILIPFMLLIAMQGWDCVVLFREYKKEQMAEIQEEKAQLEAERKRSEEMMQELLALKAQLSQNTATANGSGTNSQQETSAAVQENMSTDAGEEGNKETIHTEENQ